MAVCSTRGKNKEVLCMQRGITSIPASISSDLSSKQPTGMLVTCKVILISHTMLYIFVLSKSYKF